MRFILKFFENGSVVVEIEPPKVGGISENPSKSFGYCAILSWKYQYMVYIQKIKEKMFKKVCRAFLGAQRESEGNIW